jgi:hypothetical protein
VVDDPQTEVVIGTAGGKILAIRVRDVPTRRRETGGRGVRVIRLEAGDRVASVAVVDAP